MNQQRKAQTEVPFYRTARHQWLVICAMAFGLASNPSITAAQEASTTTEENSSEQEDGTSVGIFSQGGHDTKQPIAISSDTLEVKQDEEIAIFSGNVDAVQGEMRLRSQSLEVYYATEDGDGTVTPNSIKRMKALGRVFLSSPEETAEGDWADYDLTAAMLTLHDNVLLTRGKNVLCGQKLDMDLDSGRSVLIGACGDSPASGGRVQGLFFPAESDDESEQ